MSRWLSALVVCLAALAAGCGDAQQGAGPPPPVPVTVAVVEQKALPVEVRAIGNVQPSETVTVRARVGGILAKVHFREGQQVEEGQLLMTLDRGPLEAALRQAQATLARSRAQLENARRDAARYAELAARGFVAQQEYDRFRTAAEALEATVAADRAVVENARLQLGYATIRAPMTGRTGALLVHEGDLIKANDTTLVVINRIRPVDVSFALPERELPEVRRYRARGALAVVVLSPEGEPLGRGELSFIDNRVDPATGTIQLKASFPNADGALWPGQFVNVAVTLTTQPDAIVVPTPAVQHGQEGAYVFVVKPDQTVESRPVTVAREQGGETVVAAGVAPGETVVTEGQLRLVPGARVEARAAAPAATGGAAPAGPAPGPPAPADDPPAAPAGTAPRSPGTTTAPAGRATGGRAP
jgi:multidrug efflux system membrane fusion protein